MKELEQKRKRVLDVGQCGPDHRAIASLLAALGAEVERAALPGEAMAALEKERFDLVLVNRKIDQDYSEGMELVRMMQANPKTKGIPVMLVSNYPEAQSEAEKAGALPGFGKMSLMQPETKRKLKTVLKLDT